MKSSEFIRATLVNRTTADCSTTIVKNNRYHYLLKFNGDIGWDWIKQQVDKASREVDVQLEMWEICPSGMNAFEIEVREVQRREGIDNSQTGLTQFEE